MIDLTLSIEGVSPELVEAYRLSGMDRGRAGSKALEWAFGNSPNALAVAREDGRIVGVSGYIQTRMKLGEAEGRALQAVDSFVATEMRGEGVFTRLANAYEAHARKAGHDAIWGFPNDNAAHAWFEKLGWIRHGQVPFMFKPLRAGYFLRKLRIPVDFPVFFGRDQNIAPATEIGGWVDALWDRFSSGVAVGTIRDRAYLTHRLLRAPHADRYRIVADTSMERGALLATREEFKHGGHIAYVMEAMGGSSLDELMESELGRLRERGAEVVLTWSFPWSPNHRSLRRAGFFSLPERFRPIRMWFGSRALSPLGALSADAGNWYLSYLDSDTV